LTPTATSSCVKARRFPRSLMSQSGLANSGTAGLLVGSVWPGENGVGLGQVRVSNGCV
jgi:hypothetical protein